MNLILLDTSTVFEQNENAACFLVYYIHTAKYILRWKLGRYEATWKETPKWCEGILLCCALFSRISNFFHIFFSKLAQFASLNLYTFQVVLLKPMLFILFLPCSVAHFEPEKSEKETVFCNLILLTYIYEWMRTFEINFMCTIAKQQQPMPSQTQNFFNLLIFSLSCANWQCFPLGRRYCCWL